MEHSDNFNELVDSLSDDIVDVEITLDGLTLVARFEAEKPRSHCFSIVMPGANPRCWYDVGLYLGDWPGDSNAIIELDFEHLEEVVMQVKSWNAEFSDQQ